MKYFTVRNVVVFAVVVFIVIAVLLRVTGLAGQ